MKPAKNGSGKLESHFLDNWWTFRQAKCLLFVLQIRQMPLPLHSF